MYNDIIKLLNLDQFNLKILKADTIKKDNKLFCYITLKCDELTTCPFCGGAELTIKDYRKKKSKHSISTNIPCYIIYNARRYKCKYCNNCFYEKNPFALKNEKESIYTICIVLKQLLSHTNTVTDVARNLFLSVTTVIKIFDTYVECKRSSLPKILSFDEFYRGKKTSNKYAFVMADFIKNKIVDVFYSRHKDKLDAYFCKIPQRERDSVEYITMDMWDTYRDLAKLRFKNAKIAVDSFHVIEHLNDAIKSIRLRIMNKFNKKTKSLHANDMYYYMLKKFHYFFVKDFNSIYNGKIRINKLKTKWDKHEIRKYLLSIDDDLKYAYILKERYREFNLTASYDNCDEELNDLIEEFRNSHLEEYRLFGKLLNRWKEYIKNSFIRVNGRRLSNGPMEGINSRIKTILKSANGIKMFFRLRNRIIYSINKDVPIKSFNKEIK